MSITGTGASNYMEMVTPIIPVNMMGEKADFDEREISIADQRFPLCMKNIPVRIGAV